MNQNIKISNLKLSKLRIIGLCFFLFFISIAGFGQNDGISGEEYRENPNAHLGVKAGLGFSNIQSEELTNKTTRPSMAVGLYGNYLFKQKILLQVEFNGSLKGANFSFDGVSSSLNRLSLFYLDIPIIVHYSFVKKAKLLPFLGVQPSVIFRKDAYKSQEIVPQPVVLGIKKYDFAVTAGLLYKMHPKVGLQLQFNYGLVNVNNKAPNQLILPFYPYLGKGSPMYNRNLQLCLVF